MKTLISVRFERFMRCILLLYPLCAEDLREVIREERAHTPVMRAAALRLLVGQSPLSVTMGLPYFARRRLVRTHYAV